MSAAARVFLRDGYGLSSIDRVATEAGMSTRTICQRFKNQKDIQQALGSECARLRSGHLNLAKRRKSQLSQKAEIST
jgi:AcrR family transcriptional regulator